MPFDGWGMPFECAHPVGPFAPHPGAYSYPGMYAECCYAPFGESRNSAMRGSRPGKRMGTNAFSFPDGGWVCSSCQNYNFCGRVKCNRCKKAKSKLDFDGKPQHLLRKTSPGQVQDENVNSLNSSSSASTTSSGSFKRAKKPLVEREGDWMCVSCHNHNFSFRKNCNRCQLSRQASQLQDE